MQTLNEKGRISVDVQKIVPNAEYFEGEGDYVYILDANQDVYVYNKNKQIATVTSDYNILNGFAYNYNNGARLLQRYNLNNNYEYFKVDHVAEVKTWNNKLIYRIDNEDTQEEYICVFDTITGDSFKKLLDVSQSASLFSSYAIINNESGTKDLFLYQDGTTTSGYNTILSISSFANSKVGKSYTVLYTEMNGYGSYSMLTTTTPVVQK